ncbi:HNH endonuclease [Acidithiobacillus ferrooxidans]|uniref:HNH endonuclease n=1 Tax=Acidithiobacillus ferrooxidans TaxID=920 RepID=UPI001C07BD04|nr:HNH endonuclease [Acidithiobacillus ferrooxidans]MBU2772510.1 HNH endonuclease [Acidithiobacillus ferrooxidans]
MDIFVVRLNPDTRGNLPYTKYPTVEEYNSIHVSSPMNGFHEAINFKSEEGVIRGYLPPRHLISMRSGKPFALITITASTARNGGDLIVGIQAGCKYVGEKPRIGLGNIKELRLIWHYLCPESLSLLLDKPIPNARRIVLGNNGNWGRGPTFKLDKDSKEKILDKIKSGLIVEKSKIKYKKIKDYINEKLVYAPEELEIESSFDDDIKRAIASELDNVKGNLAPSQKEVISFQYERDPRVAAFVLKKANGICFGCKNKGPFISKVTGLPYLEVHHVKMLKDGGEDTVDNTVALCPNCHRKRHYGQ